jgi:hypothetical protein
VYGECLGSRGVPVESSVAVDEDGSTATGVCPICGKRIPLGYAQLLPVHEPPATAA